MSLQSKGEVIISMYLKRRFRDSFIKIRPDFLKNPITGRNLEYDFYCERLKLAIEYNGRQHYEYVARFHNSYEDFKSQIYRDDIKKRISREMNIALIIVPYNFPRRQHSSPYREFNSIISDIHCFVGNNNTSEDYISDMCYFLEKQLELHGHSYHWYNRLLFNVKSMFKCNSLQY